MVKYENIIQQFAIGKIDLKQLSEYVDDRLFELRQDPTSVSEEQSFLSGIELLICEINDGFRNIVELEEFIKSLFSPTPSIYVWNDSKTTPQTVTTSSGKTTDFPMFDLKPEVKDYCFQAEFA